MSNIPSAPPRPIDRLLRPIRVFGQHKLAGAGLLMAATVVAIAWANSPFHHSYHDLLHVPVSVGFSEALLSKTLHHWINDGLMGIFFFLVGLEIKRELLTGELSTLRKASLPAIAAIGGMVVPALIYMGVNSGGPAANGWGIPMATDIAFALGILALLGDRVPLGLKVFLTALAIVDDIGAVLIIAVFYTAELSLVSLAVGGVFIAVSIAMNLLRVRGEISYLVIGICAWLAFLQSGVHATIAALLMAFTIPARTRIDGERFVDTMTKLIERLRTKTGVPTDTQLNDHAQQNVLDRMATTIDDASAPLQRIEHQIATPVTFVVLPIFALANAGVTVEGSLGDAVGQPVSLGIILGLFLGKSIGVTLFTFLAVRLGIADLPTGVSWLQVVGAALLAGVGFTMALFVGGLAFPETPALLETAKIGILSASVISGLVGFVVLRFSTRSKST